MPNFTFSDIDVQPLHLEPCPVGNDPVRIQRFRNPLRLLLTIWMLAGSFTSFAQTGFFTVISPAQARLATPELKNVEKFNLYQLKTAALRNYLAVAPLESRSAVNRLRLAVPLPNGTTELFAMAKSPILAPAVAAQHPEIKTYTGKGTAHSTYAIRLSFTSTGFDAIVLGVNNSTAYITKVTRDPGDQRYATYFARDVKKRLPLKRSAASALHRLP